MLLCCCTHLFLRRVLVTRTQGANGAPCSEQDLCQPSATLLLNGLMGRGKKDGFSSLLGQVRARGDRVGKLILADLAVPSHL